ncbi:MAG: hypothetical protein GF375_04090 [Candidatus Omnitrophica bacterium]|nr:hypothetical protein [Candidatus Omnitrophota bacterium]
MAEYEYTRELVTDKEYYNFPNPDRDIDPGTGNPILPCKDIYDAIGVKVDIYNTNLTSFTVVTPRELTTQEETDMAAAIALHKSNGV